MKTTAYEFQAACRAGLQMWGTDEDKNIKWVGKRENWLAYNRLMRDYES